MQSADLAVLERIGRFAEIIREAPGEGQLIERMNPVRSEIVELPVSVAIHLLKAVVRSHAHIERHDIGLLIGKVVAGVGLLYRSAIDGEYVSGYVVAASHRFQ